ncbi:MAG: metallophosphoesterase, partial [Clostridia bacterium]|nr:metallophosphoesterase [Clostridia bacterium]
MNILKRIVPILSLPLAFLMLVTGFSFVSADKQKAREEELDAETAEDFEPVFRFAVASDVHISAGDDTTAKRLAKLFETAYRYSDSHPTYQTLDALVLTGDNCDSGSEAEYEILLGVINANIRPDETQLITVMGNHE